jgi:hypothetical protein
MAATAAAQSHAMNRLGTTATRFLVAALVLGALLPLPAAAADDESFVAPSFRAPAADALVIILPPKVDDPALTTGAPMLLNQLHRQLVAAGYKAALLDEANHDLLWRQEVEAVGGIYDAVSGQLRTEPYGKALSALAQRIAADTGCSLILRPRLITRSAKLSGFKAEWDGQARQQPVSDGFAGESRFDGSTVALSVELMALTPNGAVAFRTLGGTSLAYRKDVSRGRVEVRKDLFASEQETAEGVQLALRPLQRR